MYDAKIVEKDNDTENKLKGDCISERNYFDKVKNETFINNKVSYIPTENIFN